MDPLLVLFGLGVGALIGATGVGGGSVMTPLLILAFGTTPTVAVGTDLAYGAVTKTLGGWRHLRMGTVDTRLSLWLAAGSVPGALGGIATLEWLHGAHGDAFDDALLMAIGVAVLVTGIVVLGRTLFMPGARDSERDEADLAGRRGLGAAALGLVIGFVIGATSVGSGALIAVGLILLFRLTPRRVVGTDVFHAAILLWVAALAHLASGNVDLLLGLNILLGSLPGVWLGTHVSARLPEAGLRLALGVVLLGAGIAVFAKAGSQVPVAVLVGAGAALAAGGWAARSHRSRRQVVRAS
ncbi:MAG: sulfite exporter TauE/SafE family protein [Thermoleophilaceae bacterium]